MGTATTEIDPHKLVSIRLKALWVLNQNEKIYFTASTIAKSLIEQGISTSRQAVEYALSKRGGAVHKSKSGYRIMEEGREELKNFLSANSNEVLYIEAGKPFTGKTQAISSIFSKLSSEVRICDPYIDIRSLQIVFQNLDPSLPVKILTQTIKDKPTGIISSTLNDLRKEGYDVEIRVNTAGILHDRYIMDSSIFWYSGNSLNGLGSKESLLIALGKDIHQNMSASFDSHWKKGSVWS